MFEIKACFCLPKSNEHGEKTKQSIPTSWSTNQQFM